jgi:N-methylhydantoinase B
MAVLSSRLESIVRTMSNTIFRSGRSGIINTARDFSCCIITADGRLLTAADSLPIHVMSGPDLIAQSMVRNHPHLEAGDAFLHNSPYDGNAHAADHSVVVPVVDDGIHRFTILTKGHQADCGNAAATTYAVDARDVYEEGALIFPCVRVQQDYQDCRDIIEMCRLRIRSPDQWWGDYLALLGAARIGERKLRELGREIGWDALNQHAETWFDYSERLMRRSIARLPSGTVAAETTHDPFPGVPDGVPVSARVTVDAQAETIEVDLRDNPDCQPCGLNLTEAASRTAAFIGIFNSLPDKIPVNSGSYRRLNVLLREGCVVGIPVHPYSCSASTTNVADRVANVVQRAMAEFDGELGLAEVGLGLPGSTAVISGRRETGESFVNQLFLAFTGGPGSPRCDAWLQIGHVGNAGMMRRDSVEVDELAFPIRVLVQRVVPDSEGAGRYRGAPSAEVEIQAVGVPITAVWASDGTVNPAQGARGGCNGGRATQMMRSTSGELTELPSCAAVTIAPGESIVSRTCGGGGYGLPLERDRALVARDLAEGWITAERAAEIYGFTVGR